MGAPEPDFIVFTSVASAASQGVQTVRAYAATTRGRMTPVANRFSDHLSVTTNYAFFNLSLLPNRRVDQIEWPKEARPSLSFITVSDTL